jgi:hypothetical protein
MMNAIVYSRASTIKMVQMPIPKLQVNSSSFKNLTSVIIIVVSKLIQFFRPHYHSTSVKNGWYTNEGQCVIVRVNSAGLNPVDAKYLYGDKIPKYLQPSLRYLIENKKCGFDFSGIVSEVSSDCIYKVGDEVRLTIFIFICDYTCCGLFNCPYSKF